MANLPQGHSLYEGNYWQNRMQGYDGYDLAQIQELTYDPNVFVKFFRGGVITAQYLSGSGKTGYVDLNRASSEVATTASSGVVAGASGAISPAGGVSRSSVMVNKQANNDSIPIMYGLQRMGGTRIFVDASDGAGNAQTKDAQGNVSNTGYLNMVLCVAEGEMGDIQELYFNEAKVWDINGSGTFASGRNRELNGRQLQNFEPPYNSVGGMEIYYYPGTLTQTYCTELTASIDTWGPDTSVSPTQQPDMTSIAYLVFKLPSSDVFGGQMPSVTSVLTGKNIYDVSTLTDGAPTGSWTQTSGADQNPVDVLYDYLTSPVYGKGLDQSPTQRNAGQDIDLASFQQARIDCDAARSSSGLPFNGFLSTNTNMYENVKKILSMCNGYLLFINGKYHLRIAKKDEHLNLPDTHIFDKEHILSPITLNLPGKQNKLNKSTGIYGGSGTDWNDDLVVYNPSSYLTDDNNAVLEDKQEFSLITDEQFVLDMITHNVDYSRNMQTIAFTASHKAMQLRAGDIIDVRNSYYGWGDGPGEGLRYWRVMEISYTRGNTVEITASTYDSSKEL